MSSRQKGREWLAAAQHSRYQQLETDAFWGQLSNLWYRLPYDIRRNIENNFLPENPMERPIPGEEVQLEIRPAWYRDILGHFFFHSTWQLAVLMLLLVLIVGILAFVFQFSFWSMLLPVALFILMGVYAIQERLEFMQYRLVKTNARFVISLPQHGAWPFVDNIELKGLPTVLDTNWSRNPIWRIFQVITGARDLYISMSGYQFAEGAAKVKDALCIPDVMAADAFELKRLVFPVPDGKPGKMTLVELPPELTKQITEAIQAGTSHLQPLNLRRIEKEDPPASN
jgi:hypothetical protein